jgi:hypothetical protein
VLLGVLAAVLGLAPPLAADVEVLIPGASHRILARGGDPLDSGGFLRDKFDKVYWVQLPFGDVGWLFLNHEITVPDGGLSRLRYEDGVITEKVDWVTGTHFNCSGIVTRWRTILSCEEHPPEGNNAVGHVLEVSPMRNGVYWRRTALGRFSHEGIIEDPVTGDYYLTDDSYSGVFFKFVPAIPGNLSAGSLYALREPTRDWVLVTDMVETEQQAIALGATTHQRPEDLVYNPLDDAIYIAVTGNYNIPETRLGYILRFDPRTQEMTRWLDGDGEVLANPDNLEVDQHGNLFVHEDQYPQNAALYGNNELHLVRPDRTIETILRGLDPWGEVSGMEWGGPDERRFWINWMSGAQGSELIEITCPWSWNEPVGIPPASSPPAPELRLVIEPNPFAASARLTADLGGWRGSSGEQVRLEIFDVHGSLWRTLVDGPLPADRLDVVWDGRDQRSRLAPRGVYFARLTMAKHVIAEKLLRVP